MVQVGDVLDKTGGKVITMNGNHEIMKVENLPRELIVDILSRLPVKTLCRFKCVLKPWRSLISDPDFVKTHLLRAEFK